MTEGCVLRVWSGSSHEDELVEVAPGEATEERAAAIRDQRGADWAAWLTGEEERAAREEIARGELLRAPAPCLRCGRPLSIPARRGVHATCPPELDKGEAGPPQYETVVTCGLVWGKGRKSDKQR